MTNYKAILYVGTVVAFLPILQGCSLGSANQSPDQKQEKPVTQPVIHTVDINQMKFNPSELNVRKGDQILFINHDMVTHDVTEETKKAWHSPPLAPGQQWLFTALEPASYYCSIHVVMKGKIRVE